MNTSLFIALSYSKFEFIIFDLKLLKRKIDRFRQIGNNKNNNNNKK